MKACNCDNWTQVEAASKAALTEEIVAFIEQHKTDEHPESNLIAVLHMVQDHFGFLSPHCMDAVAQLMRVPAAKVAGVATFYHYFRLVPCGRYIIRVCMGTACYVKGSDRIALKIQEELGIDFGETTKDGVFSLEASRCLGTCGLAPVMMIGEDVYGQLTADQVPGILDKYLDQARRAQQD